MAPGKKKRAPVINLRVLQDETVANGCPGTVRFTPEPIFSSINAAFALYSDARIPFF
jgi:hypothetical protein